MKVQVQPTAYRLITPCCDDMGAMLSDHLAAFKSGERAFFLVFGQDEVRINACPWCFTNLTPGAQEALPWEEEPATLEPAPFVPVFAPGWRRPGAPADLGGDNG